MGWITAIQPNGKICILSTIVDSIIEDNLTDEEYIKFCVEQAAENAKYQAESILKRLRRQGGGFEKIKNDIGFNAGNSVQNIRLWLKKVGDPNWDKHNFFDNK